MTLAVAEVYKALTNQPKLNFHHKAGGLSVGDAPDNGLQGVQSGDGRVGTIPEGQGRGNHPGTRLKMNRK